ncbi:MAG: O-antigen ligase family protein [Proteobacteria bacterium]|nr:O-antigen ligase family protein [Pseudomonadota bacterium]
MKPLLKLYVFSIFLLHAFSFVPLASFNFPIAVAASLVCFLQPTPPSFDFRASNLLVGGLLGWGIVAWLIYPVPIDLDRFQGLAQWSASILILWIGVRRWIAVSEISFLEISKAAWLGSVTLSVFVILEFVLANTAGMYLSDIFPFSIDKFPEADVFMAGIARPRGFAAEAGFSAMVFEALIPLALFYLGQASGPSRLIYGGLCFVALVLLYSTTFFLAAALTVALLQMIRMNYRKIAGALAVGMILAYIIAGNSTFFFNASGYKIFEFFDALNYSAAQGSRQEALAAAFSLLKGHPFGIGWGTVLQEAKTYGTPIDEMIGGTGLISLWLELAIATGIIGLLVFGTFVWKLLLGLARSTSREAHCCFLALGMLTIHHIGVYEVWFPMFWFILGLSQLVLKEERIIRHQNAIALSEV